MAKRKAIRTRRVLLNVPHRLFLRVDAIAMEQGGVLPDIFVQLAAEALAVRDSAQRYQSALSELTETH
jgi:hypothetical protein